MDVLASNSNFSPNICKQISRNAYSTAEAAFLSQDHKNSYQQSPSVKQFSSYLKPMYNHPIESSTASS
jgi:hypothetical protein